jgi:hypothetical protein
MRLLDLCVLDNSHVCHGLSYPNCIAIGLGIVQRSSDILLCGSWLGSCAVSNIDIVDAGLHLGLSMCVVLNQFWPSVDLLYNLFII